MELTSYWWPQVAANYSNNPPQGPRGSHCSGFVATGSTTRDGKPVIAHESFDDFWSGQYFNVCEEVHPTNGHAFKMQTVPGYIDSMTDFYVTDAGLGITETTIAGFVGYDVNGMPEFIRARKATQYANNIDQWVKLVNEGNNGGYANIWLLCNINTGEIARYEQGLKNQELLESTLMVSTMAAMLVIILEFAILSVSTTAIMILVSKLVLAGLALSNYCQKYQAQLTIQ